MRVVFLFIDGLGLAVASGDNPLATTPTPYLDRLLCGRKLTLEAAGYHGPLATLLALDATLGVPGCPQSATGQTTLFCGVNAAAAIGRHLNGFPNEQLRNILAVEGMLKKIKEAGLSPTFLNAYRPEFFRELAAGRRNFSASTMLNFYAGLPFRTFADMARGEAIYSDITNEWLRTLGYDVPVISPEAAGERLARVAKGYDFLLFEHFLTDICGHRRDRSKAAELIGNLDRFIASSLSGLDLSETLFLLTSDHGNLEDLATGTHTTNPVPLLLVGRRPANISRITDLAGVMPLVMQALKEDP